MELKVGVVRQLEDESLAHRTRGTEDTDFQLAARHVVLEVVA